VAERGLPLAIRCDNGPELTHRHVKLVINFGAGLISQTGNNFLGPHSREQNGATRATARSALWPSGSNWETRPAQQLVAAAVT
jgi:hypothetical protein